MTSAPTTALITPENFHVKPSVYHSENVSEPTLFKTEDHLNTDNITDLKESTVIRIVLQNHTSSADSDPISAEYEDLPLDVVDNLISDNTTATAGSDKPSIHVPGQPKADTGDFLIGGL
jgi:hypothetical protein